MAPPTPRSALLLLPPSPQRPSPPTLKAAYGATLFAALGELANPTQDRARPALLTIAVPAPFLAWHTTTPRPALYARTQRLIAGIYQLVTLQSTQLGLPIDPSNPSGVDARVILLASPPTTTRARHHDEDDDGDDDALPLSPEAEMQGPIINVQTLARSGRQWDVVYAVQTKEGEGLLQRFQAAAAVGRGRELLGAGLERQDGFEVRLLRGGVVSNAEEPATGEAVTPPAEVRRHWHTVVGGTFDHLHIGHKLLLTMTAFAVEGAAAAMAAAGAHGGSLGVDAQRRTVTIGITGDEMLKSKKYAQHLEPWDQRQQAVQEFLTSLLDFTPAGSGAVRLERTNEPGLHGRAVLVHLPARLTLNCVEISDAFGPTITDDSASALVVSAETRQGGSAINERRQAKGWPALQCFEVDVLDAEEAWDGGRAAVETFQAKLSSTQIRQALG